VKAASRVLCAQALGERRGLVGSHSKMLRPYMANVVNEIHPCSTAEQIVADFGRLDGLMNNSGIIRESLLIKVKTGAVLGQMSLDGKRLLMSI
jgi:3-oxoacyl-[acyl-carrier protein] reductase